MPAVKVINPQNLDTFNCSLKEMKQWGLNSSLGKASAQYVRDAWFKSCSSRRKSFSVENLSEMGSISGQKRFITDGRATPGFSGGEVDV